MFEQSLIIAAAFGCGLVAGIFVAFSNFVMPALARLDAQQGLAAMQSINITVLNPGFLGLFMGTAILCLVVLVWQVFFAATINLWLVAAGLCYLLGCFAVTAFANVPRNKALALISVDDALSEAQSLQWQQYLAEWTYWNHWRSLASALAMLLFMLGL
ncbi:membrane protein [Agarivorans sp. OAG1]|uniref:anthrone oxygenase family protein n=1 Tax=Agarivorans sp. OAG1 TaxID=3082387 RepID=UPI002B2B8E59|nr:membrane protein [Agarivorans sp. OAG1]